MIGNPFEIAAPIARREQLVGRDADVGRLLELATSGTYVMLEAPRRYGKTSLVNACAHRWQETGGLAVQIDFSRVLTASEAAARVEQALGPAAHPGWDATLRELLRSLRLRVGPAEIGGLPTRAVPDPTARLHGLLEVAADAARGQGQRSLVCLDEFQDVLAVPGLDGVIRSHVQHHAESVSYVFCGSEPSLLRRLFAERGRPLYAQAKPLRLGRIRPELLAAHVIDAFARREVEAGEAVERLAIVGAGHPQRTMLLAWHLWDLAEGDASLASAEAEAAVASAVDDARPEFEATWRALAPNERRVAAALALGMPPLGKDARLATGVASASSAQTALARLVEQGLAERGERAVLTDPLFAVWLAREHAG